MNKRQTPRQGGTQMGLFGFLVAIGIASPIAVPIGIVFLILYLGEAGDVFLVLFILTVLLYLLAIILIMRYLKKGKASSNDSYDYPATVDTGESNVGSAFLLGMLGGTLLSKGHRKDRQPQNDFLWQEKIRRDMQDDGFTDW